MSDRTFWIIVAGWALVLVAIIVWLVASVVVVGNALDPAQGDDEDGNLFIVDSVPDNDLSRELLQEQREYNDRHRVPRPAKEDFDKNDGPFLLDEPSYPRAS